MQMNLTKLLPLCQDSYLGNIYLGIEAYLRRSRTGYGCPAAGAAPPDKRQGLAIRVGQAAHDDTGVCSPVPETGTSSASHARTAPRFPVRAHHRPLGYDHIATPDRGSTCGCCLMDWRRFVTLRIFRAGPCGKVHS